MKVVSLWFQARLCGGLSINYSGKDALTLIKGTLKIGLINKNNDGLSCPHRKFNGTSAHDGCPQSAQLHLLPAVVLLSVGGEYLPGKRGYCGRFLHSPQC